VTTKLFYAIVKALGTGKIVGNVKSIKISRPYHILQSFFVFGTAFHWIFLMHGCILLAFFQRKHDVSEFKNF